MDAKTRYERGRTQRVCDRLWSGYAFRNPL